MRIDILTLFPEMFESPLNHSILKRAQDAGVVEIALVNIRDFATDSYNKVDDKRQFFLHQHNLILILPRKKVFYIHYKFPPFLQIPSQ